MTTYRFSPANTDTFQYWDTASLWSTDSVPNGGGADVVIPQIPDTQPADQVIPYYVVGIQTGEAYSVSTLDVRAYSLYNLGSLTVLNEVTVGGGSLASDGTATYSFGSLENDGVVSVTGTVSVAGDLINRGIVDGTATITAARFENIGTLFDGEGPLTIAISSGGAGFVNLAGGTLTGGTYELGDGQDIDINVHGPITDLAANLQMLGSATLQTYGASGTTYVPIQSSLTTIAPSGMLATEVAYINATALTVQGQIVIDGGSVTAPSLFVAAGGSIAGSAFSATATLTASGVIVDDGAILATINPETEGPGAYENSTLVIASAVSGSGVLVVGTGESYTDPTSGQVTSGAVTLALAASDSTPVIFADATGILQLDAPASFTGAIRSFTTGDTVVLSGISLGSVTATTYSGSSTQGVLSLTTGSGVINLDFTGNYTTASFAVAAGAQSGSIAITDVAGSVSPNWSAVAAVSAYKDAALPTGAIVVDSASAVAAQIDALETAAAAGDLSAIILTDLDSSQAPVVPPSLSVTATQYLADSRVFTLIDGAYTVTVTGATALQAEGIAGGSHVGSTAVVDSIADVTSQIDQLGPLAATGQVSSIAITDTTYAPISVTSTQFANDHTVFEDMTGDFTVTVSTSAAGGTIEGLSGHGVTVVFSGTASDYSLTAQGDGIGLTVSGQGVTDSLRTVTAVQFSDFTDIVAQTPGSGGAVTTGNIAELYGAVFGRLPDVPGLAFYQAYLAANPTTSLTTFAQYFLASPEYTGDPAHTYAESTAGDTQFITDSYENLLHRAPETGAIPYYLNVIDGFTNGLTPGTAAYAAAQTLGHAYVLTYFSQSPEFLSDVQVTAANPSSAQHWLVLI